MQQLVIGYLLLALAFMGFFAVVKPVDGTTTEDVVVNYVLESWRGRVTGALLWPLLVIYVGLKMYDASKKE